MGWFDIIRHANDSSFMLAAHVTYARTGLITVSVRLNLYPTVILLHVLSILSPAVVLLVSFASKVCLGQEIESIWAVGGAVGKVSWTVSVETGKA